MRGEFGSRTHPRLSIRDAFEAVAEAADGVDQRIIARIVDLGPQAADVDVHNVGQRVLTDAPNVGQDALTAE